MLNDKLSDMAKERILYTTLTLLLCSLLLNACQQEEFLDVNQTDEIHFLPSESVATRAGLTDLQTGGFSVWGDYTLNGQSVKVFNGRKVYYTTGWRYDNPEYWTTGASYTFFALYPPVVANDNSYTIPAENGYTISNNILTYDASKQVDLLYAYATATYTGSGSVSTVPMNFCHTLAAIDFSIKLQEGITPTNSYELKSIEWGGMFTQGSFPLNSGNTPIQWTYIGKNDQTVSITQFSATQLAPSVAITPNACVYIIPQNPGNVTLNFNLQINGESITIPKVITGVDWEAGQRYLYNVTIAPTEITVETTPWETPRIDDIVIET